MKNELKHAEMVLHMLSEKTPTFWCYFVTMLRRTLVICYFDQTKSFVKPDKNTKIRKWHINALQTSLGEKLCYLLPIIHAIGGCDTTSRLYGIGKGLPVKKAMPNSSFAKQLE